MTPEKPQLKLFVVGESSGNPDDWSAYNCYRALVLAPNAEIACGIAEGRPAVLVESAGSVLLMWEGYGGD